MKKFILLTLLVTTVSSALAMGTRTWSVEEQAPLTDREIADKQEIAQGKEAPKETEENHLEEHSPIEEITEN